METVLSSIPWLCMHRGCVHVEHGSHALPTLQCPAPAIRGSSIRIVLQKEDWSELVNYPLSCHYSTVCGQVTGPWHASIGSPKSQSEIWTPLPVNLFTGIVLLHALAWPGASLINSFWPHLLHVLLVVAARWKLRSLWLWFVNCFILKSNRCFYVYFFPEFYQLWLAHMLICLMLGTQNGGINWPPCPWLGSLACVYTIVYFLPNKGSCIVGSM